MRPVTVPVAARGADRLFDAFAALPGIDLARLVSVSSRAAGETLTIWERSGAGPSHAVTDPENDS